jgi:hypothetical protein
MASLMTHISHTGFLFRCTHFPHGPETSSRQNLACVRNTGRRAGVAANRLSGSALRLREQPGQI